MKKKVLKKIKGKQRLNNLRPGAKHTLVMLLDILRPLQGFKMHRVIKKVTQNCQVMQDGQ